MSGSNMLLPSVGRPVVLRMYASEWPLIRAFGLASVTFSVGLIVIMARGALWPVAPGPDVGNFVSGTIAFLGAGLVASLMGTAAWELRACPFARNTPRLAAQLVREIRIGGFILFGAAVGLGAAIEGALVGASWFLAIAAALGYAVGLLNSLAPFASRFGAAVGLLLAVSPILLMPEIATVMTRAAPVGGFLWAMLGAAMVLVSTEVCGATLTRRDGRADGELDPSPDARLFGRATASRRAPRDGADRFRGTRRSDLDWVRAILHEQLGAGRGGLVGRMIRFAFATAIVMFVVRLFLHALSDLRVATTAAAAEGSDPSASETLSFALVQQGLSGFSLDWFTRSFASRHEEMIATNVAAVILCTVFWNRMSVGALLSAPIARRRRAWIVWLATQADELAAFAGILLGFLATALIVASASQGDPWPIIGRFGLVTTAAFALLPVTRWIRLRWLDRRARSRPLDSEAEIQDPRVVGVYAVSVGFLTGGALLSIRLWQDSSAWLESELPAPIHAWLPLVALVPIILLRWLWLVALRRYFTRSDLAA